MRRESAAHARQMAVARLDPRPKRRHRENSRQKHRKRMQRYKGDQHQCKPGAGANKFALQEFVCAVLVWS